jgi:hypothetical protein
VTLKKRTSKNVYDLESVKLVPHPPLEIESGPMARHYVATYALFRVSPGAISLVCPWSLADITVLLSPAPRPDLAACDPTVLVCLDGGKGCVPTTPGLGVRSGPIRS